jgi:hypothetical protein
LVWVSHRTDQVGNPATPCYAAQSLLDQSGMREEEPLT